MHRNLFMMPKHNMQHHQTCHLLWMQLIAYAYKQSLESSSTMPGLLIPPCSQPWVPKLHSKPMEPRQPWKHLHAVIPYTTSEMVLWAHGDASYLTAPKGRSRATTDYHFLSSRPSQPPNSSDSAPPDNGPIDILYQIMCNVVASAAEAELGVLFLKAQHACPLCITLLEQLGYPTTCHTITNRQQHS